MTEFIFSVVFAGVLLLTGVILFFIVLFHPYFDFPDCWLPIFVLIASLLCFVLIFNSFFQCPVCGVFSSDDYCVDCGTCLNPKVYCSECQKEFDDEEPPLYCPDCGNQVKE